VLLSGVLGLAQGIHVGIKENTIGLFDRNAMVKGIDGPTSPG
jgi:hypothetical protein